MVARMINIMVTAKVAKKIKTPLKQSTIKSTNILGDWYVHFLILQRQHILLAISARTLLPILISAKNIASLPINLKEALKDILIKIDISNAKIENEILQMDNWVFAKTASRSALGTINDFSNLLRYQDIRNRNLMIHAMTLANTPCSPIGMMTPLEATRSIFEKVTPIFS